MKIKEILDWCNDKDLEQEVLCFGDPEWTFNFCPHWDNPFDESRYNIISKNLALVLCDLSKVKGERE